MSVKLLKKTAKAVKQILENAPDDGDVWARLPIELLPGKVFPVMRTENGEADNAKVNKVLDKMVVQLTPSSIPYENILWKIKVLWSDRVVGEIKAADMLKIGDKYVIYVVVV